MKRLHLTMLFCVAWTGLCLSSPLFAADASSPVFEYKDLDSKPAPSRPIKVRFPSSVRKKGVPAEIVLRFKVTKKGEVTDMIVVRFTDPAMIEPAMESYGRAKFTAGTKNGAPVDSWMEATETVPAK